MDELIEILRRGANGTWALGLSEAQLTQFRCYAELLVEWNATRMNLTRLTTPRDIAVKHFLDALAVLTVTELPPNARMIDVGTGAGVPGLVLKIARPDLRVTLLDSTAKKLMFCRAVAEDLALRDVVTLHARAEDAGRQPEHAAAYDFVLARAVAPLATLLPWCAPFLGPDGLLVTLKGAAMAEELVPARSVAHRVGLTLQPPAQVTLPETDEPLVRQVVLAHRQGGR